MEEKSKKRKINISADEVVQLVPEYINRNERLTFYYDDSNNSGKLWLKPDKSGVLIFNTDIDENFIIAGIACNDTETSIDKDALWTRLGLSYQDHELKFSKQFSEGDFLDTIAKKRVLDFFQWLDEQGYYIHVANINIFYYGIVDIIDSIIDWDDLRILCNGADYMCAGKLFEIKEDLYQALHSHKDEVQTFFAQYEYPNMKDSEQVAFCDELLRIVNKEAKNNQNLQYFVKRLEEEKYSGDLIFLKRNKSNILLKGFAQFYRHLYTLFPKSKHIFDKQNQISKELEQAEIIDDDTILDNFSFQDSKDVLQIQISDVISGVYGKIYTYVNKNNDEDIEKDIINMSINQLKVLQLILKIQLKSNERNEGFFFSIVPLSHRDRVIKMLMNASGQLKKEMIKNFLKKH